MRSLDRQSRAEDRCDRRLTRQFEEQVKRTPAAPAANGEDHPLTYGELNARANQLAHHLRGLALGPETVVAVCVERSPDLLIALLGILKAGAAYLPLDAAYPEARRSFMMQDAQVPVLVTQSWLVDDRLRHGALTVCLDTDRSAISGQPPDDPPFQADERNLAYVIYTSGSTGRPKGVPIEHRSLSNLLESMRQHLGARPDDRWLALTSVSFDMAAVELYLPLMVGAAVRIAGRTVAADGRRIRQILENEPVTVMQATPATWRMLLAAGWNGNPNLTMLSAGEALPRDLANELLQRGAILWNLYGPTETTIYSTAHRVTRGSGPVPIGRPIANTLVQIMDESQQPVAPGQDGELWIGGVGVARGYLNRPELSAERFVTGLSGELSSRWYRTGDLARCRPDGNIEFLGRLDHQVKIRGVRIEPGEIEAVLRELPVVMDAVVVAREAAREEKRLVAYVVFQRTAGTADSGLATVNTFLRQRLPPYMLPSALVPLDALPLTANGKVDRSALPPPEAARQPARHGRVEPRDALELEVRQLMESVLDRGPMGVTDSFSDIGLDSLAVVALMTAVEERFGYDVPVEGFLERPTIEHLADMIRARNDYRPVSPLVAIRASGSRPPVFCVHGAGGVTFPLYDLGLLLRSDRPFYALQDPSLDGKREPCRRVEDMAAQYVDAIRLVQAAGPYLLAGLSFGGLVAFEMARQLRQGGEKVALLALLDTAAPRVGDETASSFRRRLAQWRWTARFYGSVWRYSLPYFVDNLYLVLASRRHRRSALAGELPRSTWMGSLWGNLLLAYFQGHADMGRAVPRSSRLHLNRQPRMRRSVQLLAIHEGARRRYKPAYVYPDKITLFQSTRPTVMTEGYGDGTLGWSRFAGGGTETHWIEGSNHFTVIRRPFVQALAEKLGACVDALDG